MKKLSLLFVAIFAAASVAMAESVTVTMADGVYSSTSGTITWTEVNGNIQVVQMQGTTSTAVNSSYISIPRVYKGQILKFEGLNDYMIDSVKIVCSGSNFGNSMTAGIAVSENVVTDNTTAVGRTFDYSSGGTHTLRSVAAAGLPVIYLQNVAGSGSNNVKLYVASLTIYYTRPVVTSPTIEAAGFNFKTIPANLTDMSTTIAVTGQNLTAAISYSLMNTNSIFSVSGDLTTTGGNLTVAVNPTAEGVFTDTIVLTSTGATKKIALDVKVVETEGDGSQENPFTVADVKALANGYKANKWIVGTIVGTLSTSGFLSAADDVINSNIVLLTGTDTTCVALPSGSIRTAINLKDHYEYLGRSLKICGSLEAYFSMAGMKNPTDYELLPVAVDPTALSQAADEKKAVKFVKDGQIYIRKGDVIYNIFGQEVK